MGHKMMPVTLHKSNWQAGGKRKGEKALPKSSKEQMKDFLRKQVK
jgi:hypothetical protein